MEETTPHAFHATQKENFYRAALEACPASPGYAFSPGRDKQQVHFLNCKRRLCEQCGWFWSWKWRKMLADKKLSDERAGKPCISRAITLTTASDPGHEKAWSALKWFWQLIRKKYKNLQYWGVTEYNQRQTQPHFHFILSDDCYIPQVFIKTCWETAQRWAGFSRIAFDVRIEKISSNIQAYFTKYLTKATDTKNEIPRPDKWHGRFVRYSRHFFAVPVPAILASLQLNRALEADDCYRTYFLIRPKLNYDFLAINDWKMECIREEMHWNRLLGADWDPVRDRERGKFVIDIDIQLSFNV